MTDTVSAIIILGLLFIMGIFFGWSLARQYYYKWYVAELKLRDSENEAKLENMKQCFKEDLTDMIKEKDVERQNLNNKYIRILDEVSKATGINKIELPSFGIVYLNHTERLRAAIRELNKED